MLHRCAIKNSENQERSQINSFIDIKKVCPSHEAIPLIEKKKTLCRKTSSGVKSTVSTNLESPL